jgi:hypothetical protein
MEIAKTILSQIKTLDRMAMFAWGAKDLVGGDNYLAFKTSGMVRWKGYVKVEYDYGADLYSIEFYRIRKMEIKVDNRVEGVYADMLTEIIDEQVG